MTPSAVSPRPGDNQVDVVGKVSRVSTARDVVQAHVHGLRSRRERDLISEKLLLHIDGSGDFQWAEILYGQKVAIPRLVSEFRKTENILRLVVDNAVAHHTSMPLRYFAESQPDRRARDKALIDALWMNHVSYQQDLNGLFADAMYMAMPAGFCPVHCYWRDDQVDTYEPIEPPEDSEIGDQLRQILQSPGMIDCWVGNPFDHVFDQAAKRGSVYWQSYGRILPANMVRTAFDHIPEARTLEGTTNIPSAAQFQRIAQDWNTEGLSAHGSPVISHRRSHSEGSEEMIITICREVLPGVDPDWPDGRLQLVAIPGAVDPRRGEGNTTHGVLLADQPLPAGDFSSSIFYSHHRGEDVHGKPWVEDIDQLQVDLNIALSKRWEVILRMVEAPIVAPGGAINEDMADIDGYNILEIDPSLAGWQPRVMQWPNNLVEALTKEIEDRRRAIYTGGGYQASSRGESPGSRMAYRAIVALQQADNSIHGPVNVRFRRSAVHFGRLCWKQMKRYGDVPWLIDITGDEFAYMVEPYIDNTKLSDSPPSYRLVNAFGSTPELRGQEILELLGTTGADGQPFLRTDEARRQYPNTTIFDDAGDPRVVARRRAKTVATKFHHLAQQYRMQTGLEETELSDPGVQEAGEWLFYQMESLFPRLRDDDLEAHLSTLSEVTQDETSDPIARLACMRRQDLYYQWQMQMAAVGTARDQSEPDPGAQAGGSARRQGAAGRPTIDRTGVAAEMQSGGARPSAQTADVG